VRATYFVARFAAGIAPTASAAAPASAPVVPAAAPVVPAMPAVAPPAAGGNAQVYRGYTVDQVRARSFNRLRALDVIS